MEQSIDKVQQLVNMGFEEGMVEKALLEANQDTHEALKLLLEWTDNTRMPVEEHGSLSKVMEIGSQLMNKASMWMNAKWNSEPEIVDKRIDSAIVLNRTNEPAPICVPIGNLLDDDNLEPKKSNTHASTVLNDMMDLLSTPDSESNITRSLTPLYLKDGNAPLDYDSVVKERLDLWRIGKEDNIRALLLSINAQVWPNMNWPVSHLMELQTPDQVKSVYMRIIAKVHPDKWQTASDIERHLANGIFFTLNRAWEHFKKQKVTGR
jgi:hypothetical protein